MKSNLKNILFLLQIIGHPRDSKRIKMLQNEGFYVSGLAFERPYHKGRMPTCNLKSLGRIENKKYVFRLIKFIKSIPKIRTSIKQNDFVYTSGQDMAFLAFVSGLGLNKPIAMEVGDLVDLQLSQEFRGKIFRLFDRWLTSKMVLLVVISEGFINEYYKKWLGVNIPSLIIKNKLEWEEKRFENINIQNNESLTSDNSKKVIRIGYFGLLRDFWSWQILSTLAEQYYKKFKIVFAGMPINPSNLVDQISLKKNMTYLGEYKSPDGLASIYNQTDMIWACYPEIKKDDWNLCWGRPNRFYESCYFGKPCFARLGSLFAKDVAQYNIGYIIDDVDIQKVVNQIGSISFDQYYKWKFNTLSLNKEFYTFTNESSLLANKIRQNVN